MTLDQATTILTNTKICLEFPSYLETFQAIREYPKLFTENVKLAYTVYMENQS